MAEQLSGVKVTDPLTFAVIASLLTLVALDITTANFDFLQSYRPLTNLVRRTITDGPAMALPSKS